MAFCQTFAYLYTRNKPAYNEPLLNEGNVRILRNARTYDVFWRYFFFHFINLFWIFLTKNSFVLSCRHNYSTFPLIYNLQNGKKKVSSIPRNVESTSVMENSHIAFFKKWMERDTSDMISSVLLSSLNGHIPPTS